MILTRLLFSFALAISPVATISAFAAEARPNIVVILVDDMGFSDIGPCGSEIPTPNLDQLAKDGVLCTQFYNGARCCPTRAALLTGLYAHQAGIGDMVDSGPAAAEGKVMDDDSAYTSQLNHHCITIAEALQGAGYETYQSGKWHVGAAREAWPDRRGFNRSFTLLGGATNYFGRGPQHLRVPVMPFEFDGQPWEPPQEGFFTTDAFTDNAIRFIRERPADKPFFLYLAYNSPHWPLQELPENIAEFKGKYLEGWDKIREQRLQRQKVLLGADWLLSPPNRAVKNWEALPDDKKAEWDERMAIYAAQIHHMDRAVGQLLATLREQGLERNTLVLFLSDNGACAEAVDEGRPGAEMGTRDSYTSYRQAWANVSNTPFRMFKRWVEEGGISTPLIARWPAGIAPGTRSGELGHVIDLMPTCLEAAGVTYPATFAGHEITPLAGTSFLPALQGKTLASRTIFWEHEGNRAVRDGAWKLVTSGTKPWELYDMGQDRSEAHNLASAQPDRVRTMAAEYEAWAKRCKVQQWPLGRGVKAEGAGDQ